MQNWIVAAYREYVEHGHVTFSCDEDAVERFSQVQMAKRVAEALDYACDVHMPGRTRLSGLNRTGGAPLRRLTRQYNSRRREATNFVLLDT